MARAELEAAMSDLGLTVEAEFVPWSRSRKAGEKYPSLNWRVRIMRGGRVVLATDYSAGLAHCPSYKQWDRSVDAAEAVKRECETGREYRRIAGSSAEGKPIMPDAADVVFCLVADSEAIDYANYEDWAGSLGYDPDSRKGEAIYRACIKTALALRAAVGDAGLNRLREAAQDY